ncbi:MAG: hypothetical protein ACXVPN_04075 [Bacteroidia bacterium]
MEQGNGLKTVHSKELNSLLVQFHQELKSVIDKYQSKSGFSKDEIRFDISTNPETDKIVISKAINPEKINYIIDN